jgi:hypothetical protein
MAKPTINDIRLFLDDVIEKRKASLLLLSAGAKLHKLFSNLRDSLLALPISGPQNLPLTKELDAADGAFDGDGRFIFYMYEAYQNLPGFDPVLLAALKLVRDRFVPTLDVLSKNYRDEAAWVKERQEELSTYEKTLKTFPIVGGKTLYDVAVDFIEQGRLLSDLLSDRAIQLDAEVSKSRKDVSRILNSTIGLVGQCRSAIDIELKADDSTPRDLEAQVLGYYDQLVSQRAVTNKTPITEQTKTDTTSAIE